MPASVPRPIAHVAHHTRLPVWPVASGLSCWAAETIGLRGLSRGIEARFGGRVTPMSLPLAASDPFLMLVHHRHTFSRFDPLRPLSALVLPEGFPAHPHRGFETVTFVLEGGMRHRDSEGVKMIYRAGSVQWLTAGRGVLHEEMWATESPRQELYQLWVNLPRAHKWDEPEVQLLGQAEVSGGTVSQAPLSKGDVGGVTVTVLAGSCGGIVSAVRTRSPMGVVRVEWAQPSVFLWDDVPADHTALAFVRQGAISVGERRADAGALVTFARAEGAEPWAPGLQLAALEPDTDVLLMTGAPLREPVAMGGSMVMNTEAEIQDAYRDHRQGMFGPGWSPRASDAEWLTAIQGRIR